MDNSYNRNNFERLGINSDSNDDIKNAVDSALSNHDNKDLEIDQKNTNDVKFDKKSTDNKDNNKNNWFKNSW